MKYSYIPAPYTIFKHIEKVEPGCYIRINKNKKLEKIVYWEPNEIVRRAADNNIKIDEIEALELLDKTIKKSISLRSIADVPIGAFLSGGIDSSLITAMMQENSPRPINTFTIGFSEHGFNEAPYAKAIAAHLSTQHTELYVTNKHALDVIPKLPHLYDEPFGDSSQIPTYLVSKLACNSVKVCLSGDGGDELFGGYNRYTWGANLYDNFSHFPFFMRKSLGQFLMAVQGERWDSTYSRLSQYLPQSMKISALRNKIVKTSNALSSSDSLEKFYMSIAAVIQNAEELVLGGGNGHPLQYVNNLIKEESGSASWMMLEDVFTYLPGDILTKIDRASMGNSLETRVPFLDPTLFELSWTLPLSMKIRGNKGKIALRELLYRYVPKQLIERPKMGFGVPIGEWLLGPLKEWAEDLLSEGRLKREGFLNPQIVRKYWQEHCLKKRDRAHELWNILMFQSWLQENDKILSGENGL